MKFYIIKNNKIRPDRSGKKLEAFIGKIICYQSTELLEECRNTLSAIVLSLAEVEIDEEKALEQEEHDVNVAVCSWLAFFCEYRMFTFDLKGKNYSQERYESFLVKVEAVEGELLALNECSSNHFRKHTLPRCMWFTTLFKALAHFKVDRIPESLRHLELMTFLSRTESCRGNSHNLLCYRPTPFSQTNQQEDDKDILDTYLDQTSTMLISLTTNRLKTRKHEPQLLARAVNLLSFRAYRFKSFTAWTKYARENYSSAQRVFVFNPNSKNRHAEYTALKKKFEGCVSTSMRSICLALINDREEDVRAILDDIYLLQLDISYCYLRSHACDEHTSEAYHNITKLFLSASAFYYMMSLVGVREPKETYFYETEYIFNLAMELRDKDIKLDAHPYAALFIIISKLISNVYATEREEEHIKEFEVLHTKSSKNLNKLLGDNNVNSMLTFWIFKLSVAYSALRYKYRDMCYKHIFALEKCIEAEEHPFVYLFTKLFQLIIDKSATNIQNVSDCLDQIKHKVAQCDASKEEELLFCVFAGLLDSLEAVRVINTRLAQKVTEIKDEINTLLAPKNPVVNVVQQIKSVEELEAFINGRSNVKVKVEEEKEGNNSHSVTKPQISEEEKQLIKTNTKVNALKKVLHELNQNIHAHIKSDDLASAKKTLETYQNKIEELRKYPDHEKAHKILEFHSAKSHEISQKIKKLENKQARPAAAVKEKKKPVLPQPQKKKTGTKKDLATSQKKRKTNKPTPAKKTPRTDKMQEQLATAWKLLEEENAAEAVNIYLSLSKENLSQKRAIAVTFGLARSYEMLGEFKKAESACLDALGHELTRKNKQKFETILERCRASMDRKSPTNGSVVILSPKPRKPLMIETQGTPQRPRTSKPKFSPKRVEGRLIPQSNFIHELLDYLASNCSALFVLNSVALYSYLVNAEKKKIFAYSKCATIAVTLSSEEILSHLYQIFVERHNGLIRAHLANGFFVDIIPLIKTQDKQSPFVLLEKAFCQRVDLDCHRIVYDYKAACFFDRRASQDTSLLTLSIPKFLTIESLSADLCWRILLYKTRFLKAGLVDETDYVGDIKEVLIPSIKDHSPPYPTSLYIVELFCSGHAQYAWEICSAHGVLSSLFPEHNNIPAETLKNIDLFLSEPRGYTFFYGSSINDALCALMAMLLFPVFKDKFETVEDLNATEFQQELRSSIQAHCFMDCRLSFIQPIISIWKDSIKYDDAVLTAITWLTKVHNAQTHEKNAIILK